LPKVSIPRSVLLCPFYHEPQSTTGGNVMPWAKVDDQFTDHVKVVGLSLAARGMWLCGLVYAARRSTDGFIPASIPQREAAGEDAAPYVQELLDAGLWDRADGGYQIHDYLKYNPSKADTTAKREAISAARSDAGKRGADNRWHGNDDCTDDGKPMANGIANVSQTDGPVPVPLPVTPKARNPVPVDSAAKPPKPKRQQVPADWQPDKDGVTFAQSKGVAEIVTEVERFRDFHRAKGNTFLDIPAAWRTWCGNYREYNRSKPNGNGRGPKGPDFAERARQMEAAERAAIGDGR
jgi:hypothetical protein